MRKTSTLLVAVLAVLGSLTVAAPAHAWEPGTGFTFNVPRPYGGKAAQFRIISKVEKAITRTPRNQTILITSYLMDRRETVTKLIRACRRGNSVRVILDAGIDTRPARRLIRALNSDNVDRNGPDSGPCNSRLSGRRSGVTERLTVRQARISVAADLSDPSSWGTDESYVMVCDNACRSSHSAMHTKFYAFSRTGTARNVVMVSSSNLNKGGARLGWNDMWTMKDRPRSFQRYEAQHLAMTRERRAGRRVEQFRDGPFRTRFYPVIGADRGDDPTWDDLNKIGCRSPWGRTKVYVSMFWWGGTRGEYLAGKVIGLGRHGCDVKVIVGAPTRVVMKKLRTAARRDHIQLWDSRHDIYNDDGVPDVRTHSKMLMVRGRFGGDATHSMVSTGSQNWTTGALKFADENTLNIHLARAWHQGRKNWARIRNHSRRIG